MGSLPSPPIQSPFSDAAANPFSEQPQTRSEGLNPYATPAELHQPNWQTPLTIDQARARLLGPAIGMFLCALAGLGFMALAALGALTDNPAEDVIANGFFVGYFIFGMVSRVVQLAGAVAMWRVQNYSLAMTGAVCALVPCEMFCCLPSLPFGIWGLIVLNNAAVKAAFR